MSAVDEITSLLERKAAALVGRDAATLETIIDPAFIYVNALGNKFGKDEYLSVYCRSGAIRFVRQDIRNIEAIELGDVVIVSVMINDEIDAHGAISQGHYRSLCVFKKTGDAWRWVAAQTSPVLKAGGV
ncbi:nuclear transport factor 2 family protein [Terrarubrum flagellatum]|uniref:nuclear transport factor 2 family protein n=1 Tax=Terrirubrum flagellatum TaxID=2895980 RepID=UPI003145629F